MVEEVREYFDRVAPRWDQLREGFFSEAVREEVLRRLGPAARATVVDVGCGTGFLAAGLAPLAAEVHCVDASPAMLAEARRNLSAFVNVRYHRADGAGLPLASASVEAAVANMYLHHCPEPAQALREMARVLKPGGRLVLTDMEEHAEAWLREEMADLWPGFAQEAVRGWLLGAGLTEVVVESCGHT